MTATERARVESLFESALEAEPERRHDFVVAACGTNEQLRAAVLALLQAHGRPGVLDVRPERLFEDRSAPPEQIGVYRVVREIGHGGMGIVYDAERADGQFRRRVAIKIIRGTPDAELRHRVLAERQILAGLDHPNIARLLDGGVTSDGRPYLVMEHVDGLAVDVYCERMRLSVAERLQLFVVIARAVEFAHRNLIVHRDLKPSNILVTPDGRVKLLDFGVAKLLNPMLQDGVDTGQERALTLEYASPEQLRGEGLMTASDVYSLGVVLYELLTGRRPHEQNEGSLAVHVAAVCDGVVERPSVRVLRAESLPGLSGEERSIRPEELARARHTTPARLAGQLQGDVDAIVEMALRVEPQRRYGSAELLAQDIERHLTHLPVRAHGGSRGYALRKLLRRHRVSAAALTLATLAVLLGAGTAAWQATIANRERIRAQAALAQSQQVSSFVLDLFQIREEPLVTVTARDLVRRGTTRIEQLNGQPDVQAQVLGALARIYEGLGEYEEGQRAAERALSILLERGAASERMVAELRVQQGVLQRRRGEYDSAQAAFLHALEIQKRILAPDDPGLARTQHQLVGIAMYLGDVAEAERRALATLAEQQRALGEEHRLAVNTLTLVGGVQRARDNRGDAERTLRRAVELRPRTVGSTRYEQFQDRFQLATTVLLDTARSVEAEAMFRAELAQLRAELSEDLYYITWAEGALADLAERRGDAAASIRLRRHVFELRRDAFGPDHPSTTEAALFLGQKLLRADSAVAGEAFVRDAAETYRRVLGERHPAYANALVTLSDALMKRAQLSTADSLIGIAIVIHAQRYGTHGHVDALRRRADIQLRLRAFPVAEALLRDVLELTTTRTGNPASSEVKAVHEALAQLYEAWGRPAEAARHRSY